MQLCPQRAGSLPITTSWCSSQRARTAKHQRDCCQFPRAQATRDQQRLQHNLRCTHSDNSDTTTPEKELDVRSLLSEAEQLGDNFVFGDDSEEPGWEHEDRFAVHPSKLNDPEPQVRGALDPAQITDVLSAYSTAQGFEELPVDEAKARIDAGQVDLVLDVRTPAEFANGHIPGAVNIELGDCLSEAVRSGELANKKGANIAVVCQSGRRSAQATVRLTKVYDFQHVFNIGGGTLAWMQAGFDVER